MRGGLLATVLGAQSGGGGSVSGPGGTVVATITVPSGTVASSLTDFPVRLDLVDLPSGFWSSVTSDGRDIRITLADLVTEVPIDLVWIDKHHKSGLLYFKAPSVASGSNTVFKLSCGNSGLSAPAVGDANGRNAVWSGYHRVFMPSFLTDRTGSGNDLTLVNTPRTFGVTTIGAEIGVHQGVTWDGTYYYVVDTDELVKFDRSWNEIARNTGPLAATGISGVNHCGDPVVVNGELYVPIEDYFGGAPWTNQHICVFSISTLAFVRSYDVSAQGREMSGLAYNPADGYLYATDFTDGSSLLKYSLTGTYIGSLALGGTLANVQGATFFRDKLYVSVAGSSSGYSTAGAVMEYQTDGTQIGTAWAPAVLAAAQGICAGPTGLSVLWELSTPTQKVYSLEPGWISTNGNNNRYAKGLNLSKFTQWTMGVASSYHDLASGNQALLSYSEDSGTDSLRATLAYRETGAAHGLWNSSDSWLMDGSASPTPPALTQWRVATSQNGTTDRKLYRNGALVGTDTTVAQRPGGVGSGAFFIGAEDTTVSEEFDGCLGLCYLRSGVLTADWLAAEDKSWRTPTTFYSIST
jgi:hypothetical protein